MGIIFKRIYRGYFFGALIIFSKLAIRVPLKIPGHSGLLWIGILTICCLWYRQGRAGTLAGIIAGMLSILFIPGDKGVLSFFTYFIPGLFMDVVFSFIPRLTKHWYSTAIVSAFSHATKLAVNFVSGVIMNLPLSFLTLGLGMSSIYHLIFGFAGGALGYFTYYKIIKNYKHN